MFKKINQHLITNYPLVWNLKLIWISLIGIGINLIAFINGFFSYQSISQLLDYNLFDSFYDDGYVIFYFIVCLIIFILWLYYYIKNNRFKSKYPTSRNYLFKEFLSVFGIILLFMLIPNMFKLGITTRVDNSISEENFEKDVDLINRITPFTLQTNNGYSNYSRNLPVPVFDTLVSSDEVAALYEKDKKAYQRVYPGASYIVFNKPYFRNEAFKALLYDKLKDKVDLSQDNGFYFPEYYYEYNREIDVSNEDFRSENETTVKISNLGEVSEAKYLDVYNDLPEIYSLYNFSQRTFKVPNHPNYTQKYYDEKLIKTLQNNDLKEIEKNLTAYQKLLDKYKIGYRFKDKKWIEYIPQAPYFIVKEELSSAYSVVNDRNLEKDYINADSLIQIYKNIESAKYNTSIFAFFQYIVLGALFLTLLVIIFRFTSFKNWLISLVGFGILGIIFSCIQLFFEIINVDFYNEYIISILLYILFILVALRGLSQKTNKIITGVALNWFVLSSTFIVLICLGLYKEIVTDVTYNKYQSTVDEYVKHPKLEMIDKITESYFYYFPILFIIFFYFIINWYKKWQAMPEE